MNNSKHQEATGFRRTWIDHTSELAASADSVFALLSDIDGWPSWTPGLPAIKRRGMGTPRVGSAFTMVIKPAGLPKTLVPCKLIALEPNFVEWGGGFGNPVIRHSFSVEPLSPLRCRVR